MLGIISQVSFTLFSETGSVTALELMTRKSQGSACLSLSVLPALGLQTCKSVPGFFSFLFFFIVLGLRLRSSYLQGEYSTNVAISSRLSK